MGFVTCVSEVKRLQLVVLHGCLVDHDYLLADDLGSLDAVNHSDCVLCEYPD